MIGPAASTATDRRRLGVRVAIGIAGGLLYTLTDIVLDRTLGAGATPSRLVALGHAFVDLVLPVIVGAVLGVAVHYLRLRAEAAEAERREAEDLRGSLQNIERDQAVWVVAASLLHELRTPLHALGLLLDELAALPADAVDERGALIERARAQGERLIAQVGALKSVPGSERPELPELDVAALVRRFTAAESARREAEVRLRAHTGGAVNARANAAYVQIILENLVENSLYALRERGGVGAIDIDVESEGPFAIVRVRDDGPGLDAETAGSLFEPLRSTKAQGLGLGLSIARALARAMQGDLTLEKAAPPTFRLALPTGAA